MKAKLSFILLWLLINLLHIQLACSAVYCKNCTNWVTPLLGGTCPICGENLPGPSSGEEPSGACAIDPDFSLAMKMQEQEWGVYQTASDHLIALTLQPNIQMPSVTETFDSRDDAQITSVVDSHQQAEQNAFEQLLKTLSSTQITFRNDKNLESIVTLTRHISNTFTTDSDGTQNELDSIIQGSGFNQVPINDACFYGKTANELTQHIFSEVQDQSPHEYLLVFFQPVSDTDAYYHFIPLVFWSGSVSIIIPTLDQESYLTIPIDKSSINIILLTFSFQLQATEFYAYHRLSAPLI